MVCNIFIDNFLKTYTKYKHYVDFKMNNLYKDTKIIIKYTYTYIHTHVQVFCEEYSTFNIILNKNIRSPHILNTYLINKSFPKVVYWFVRH